MKHLDTNWLKVNTTFNTASQGGNKVGRLKTEMISGVSSTACPYRKGINIGDESCRVCSNCRGVAEPPAEIMAQMDKYKVSVICKKGEE